MSDLLDAAKHLLDVLGRDHSLAERHAATDALAVATGDIEPVAEPVAVEPEPEAVVEAPVAEVAPTDDTTADEANV